MLNYTPWATNYTFKNNSKRIIKGKVQRCSYEDRSTFIIRIHIYQSLEHHFKMPDINSRKNIFSMFNEDILQIYRQICKKTWADTLLSCQDMRLKACPAISFFQESHFCYHIGSQKGDFMFTVALGCQQWNFKSQTERIG